MTDQELIARLREGATWDDDVFAANRIEELVKERDRSEQGWAVAKKAVDRGMGLERKLTKAVDAIKQSIQKWESPHYNNESVKINNAFDGFELLHAVLAELEGKE